MRKPHQHHRHTAEVKFGKKVWGGRVIDNFAEQDVVKVIFKMRDLKMGLREIARLLSQMKVPTKCKKARWHPEMIRRILAN